MNAERRSTSNLSYQTSLSLMEVSKKICLPYQVVAAEVLLEDEDKMDHSLEKKKTQSNKLERGERLRLQRKSGGACFFSSRLRDLATPPSDSVDTRIRIRERRSVHSLTILRCVARCTSRTPHTLR